MEPLFKFALIRPAIEQAEELPSIELAKDTGFQRVLEEASTGGEPRVGMKAAARTFVATPDFVTDTSNLGLEGLDAFSASLDQLEKGDEPVNNSVLQAAVQGDLGASAADIVSSRQFINDTQRLSDSILAIKLLPEEHQRPLHRLTRLLRDLDLIIRIASDEQFPENRSELRRYHYRSLALPPFMHALGSVLSTRSDDKDRPDADDRRKKFAELLGQFRSLVNGIDELTSINGRQLVQMPPQPGKKSLIPEELRPVALFKRRIEEGLRPIPADQRTTFSGRLEFQPGELSSRTFMLTEEAGRALSTETKNVLKERGLRIGTHALDEIVDTLHAKARETYLALSQAAGNNVQRTFKRVGNTLVSISTPVASPWTSVAIGTLPELAFPVPFDPPEEEHVPDSHGNVTPAGVADLIIVKQQLTGYEATDVAHIENILMGEGKVRTHERRTVTERITFRETEVTTTEERELESTDRFEMTRETNETIREEAALKAGLTVSGKYGPSVEFSASAEGSISRTREQSTKAASTFSKETTERSATKIAKRVLERESLKVTTDIFEKNEHTLNNTDGDGHIRGIYQWVEKVYEAQMFNYGLRMIFDFTVPEPAAFLIAALRRGHASATELQKPIPFTATPTQINEFNYPGYVAMYGATDVEPPPEPFRTKSMDFAAGGGDDNVDYNHSAQVTIDDGYRAIFATVGITGNVWDDDASVDVVIGSRANRILNAGFKVWATSLDNERGSVPFALNTFRQSGVAVAVEVKCERTDHAVNKWRHSTHAKLTLAYRARLAEYEEKLAALQLQAGVEIEGQSPAANLEMMNDELKKACTSILTDQHYDLFGAIEDGLNGLPQTDLAENEFEGPYVRFFEQAFEWQHMTWVTYPYFWGRKSQWTDRIAFEDPDPLFNQFLKAGYCRVNVPVRPGFEGAVDHFMNFGEPWVGGPLPPITSDLYLPIADELAERLDRPGDEIPEGDPWLVRIPTNLVRLRDDGSLPSWHKDSNGEWVPD